MEVREYLARAPLLLVSALLLGSVAVAALAALQGAGRLGVLERGDEAGLRMPVGGNLVGATVAESPRQAERLQAETTGLARELLGSESARAALVRYTVSRMSTPIMDVVFSGIAVSPAAAALLLSGYSRRSYMQALVSSTLWEYYLRVVALHALATSLTAVPVGVFVGVAVGGLGRPAGLLAGLAGMVALYLSVEGVFLVAFTATGSTAAALAAQALGLAAVISVPDIADHIVAAVAECALAASPAGLLPHARVVGSLLVYASWLVLGYLALAGGDVR
ncbi:MAG: hypothetical protein LRS49_06065 [Desulfurococcales archaeon]|nr:hypothetical protein [Desulfurococcales archaeon]